VVAQVRLNPAGDQPEVQDFCASGEEIRLFGRRATGSRFSLGRVMPTSTLV